MFVLSEAFHTSRKLLFLTEVKKIKIKIKMRKGTKNYGNYLHFLSVKEGQTGGRKKSIQTLRSDLAQEVYLCDV